MTVSGVSRVSLTRAAGPRRAALAFCDGVHQGWILSDLLAWAQEHLVEPRRLRLKGTSLLTLQEEGTETVRIEQTSLDVERNTAVGKVLRASRRRVSQSLCKSIEDQSGEFVNTALYTGRVYREWLQGGSPQWSVSLDESDSLSNWVLALFAADALTHPEDYNTALCVCRSCGCVSFQLGAISRQGCPLHPFGVVDGPGAIDTPIASRS